jgi:3',5'-cyclic AMP phosphodiesterase CpdA
MRTLVHLSDLHFGRVDPALLDPLRRAVADTAPDVVVVSGDLTQRARAWQFRQARAFLDGLPQPQIVVPGNHDVPLDNVFRRFVNPLASYRRYISTDLEPVYRDGEIAVCGINTARSLTFKGGRINETQAEHVRATLCGLPERITKIVVTHHPFDVPCDWEDGQIVGRASMAMRMLARCGADILLAGHMHMAHAGNTARRYRLPRYAALVVQAGTATSTRERGEANSFNVVRIAEPRVRVERHVWQARAQRFALDNERVFARSPEGWREVGDAAAR